MADTTTVQIAIEVANRLKLLIVARSQKLGLPKTISQRDYIEMLINEEEIRTLQEEN